MIRLLPSLVFYLPFQTGGGSFTKGEHVSDRPTLKMVNEDGTPQARATDALFEMARIHERMSQEYDRLFIAFSDMLHEPVEIDA